MKHLSLKQIKKLPASSAESVFFYFFPERCILCCREIKPGTRHRICKSCLDKIPVPVSFPTLSEKFCSKCSRTLISETAVCTVCRTRDYCFISNRSLWSYSDETVKRILHNYKFSNLKKACYFFSDKLLSFYRLYYEGFAVVPVPCSSKRLKNNGWDHMALISSCLKKNRIDVLAILKRKPGKEQKKLSSKERLDSRKKRFYIRKNFDTEKLSLYKGILIIDDIFTTGSTVNECSEILLNTNKNNNIHILTIALD